MFSRAICLAATILLLTFCNVSADTEQQQIEESKKIAWNFIDAYKQFLKTEQETPELIDAAEQFGRIIKERRLFKKDYSEYGILDTIVSSLTCNQAVEQAVDLYYQNTNTFLTGNAVKRVVKSSSKSICKRLKVTTEEVCENLIESNFPIFDFILQNAVVDSETFCSMVLKGTSYTSSPEYNFTIAVDESRIPQVSKKATGNPGKNISILHLSDFHYDPLYTPGSLAECEEPLCCQRQAASYNNTAKGAGYWADYRYCDLPWHLIDDSVTHIAESHAPFDYIYYTGDIVDHMVWGTSIEKNTKVITDVMQRLRQQFNNTPIYSCIGNHEPHPLNVFSPQSVPSNINTRWLYEILYDEWKYWLPESTQETILKGGYYTVTPKPGFRIIALNSNECYVVNWWLYYNGTDKSEQLQWFHDTLLAAEQAGEYVHILTHVPSGDTSCWNVWSREYNRILARFSNIISGIFNGHSHDDELSVHYTQQGHALAVSWNGGSLTTYEKRNPNYKVFVAEDNAMQILDYETWIFNVMEANLHGAARRPRWYREYSFSDFTTDLSPAGVDKLLEKLADNPEMMHKLWTYKSASSDIFLSQGCNETCLQTYLCRIARTVNDQEERCNQLKSRLANAMSVRDSGASSLTVSCLISAVILSVFSMR